MNAYELTPLIAELQAGRRWFEVLRVPALSVGLYTLKAGEADPQQPHTEDEVYYVLRGRAVVQVGREDRPVGPGSLIYVPATEPHRFHAITEDLTLLVVFAPAEGTRAPSAAP
jgi:mannose-6-phosphate isomerase-like protein (cupin superfamily)